MYGKYIDVKEPNDIKIMKFRHFKHYTEPIYYLRLFFDKLDERRNNISYFREPKNFRDFTKREMNNEDGTIVGNCYETASDDLSCYYRKVCRDYKDTLKFADWGEFKNYELDDTDKFKCRCFNVDIKDYSVSKEGIGKDKIIECNFDIETYSNIYTQGVPKALNSDLSWNPHSCVFMICMNFNYWYSNETLLNVCITDRYTAPMDNKLTIICENEEEIIQCFAQVFENMAPDLLIGFNSGSYDIPFIIETASKIQTRKDGVFGNNPGRENKDLLNDILKKMAIVRNFRPYIKTNYSTIQIKMEAGRNVDENILQLPGFICLDVMNIYRKIYNKSPKYSLKFFLTENKLGNKYDLPYQKLFYIYKLASLKKRLGSEFKKFENTKYLHKLSDFFDSNLENDYTKEQVKRIKDLASKNTDNIKDREKFYRAAADIELSEFDNFTDKQIKVMEVNFKEMDYVDELMALAGEYCVIDSLSCHKLMLCRNVLQDKREMANMAYCNIFDCVFRADGMKVRNMIIANGQTEGIVFSNITVNDDEKKFTGKYPGAFVVDPIQGLYKAKPNLVEFWKAFQK
jgi:DNA polymerase elongation subunit (family B)